MPFLSGYLSIDMRAGFSPMSAKKLAKDFLHLYKPRSTAAVIAVILIVFVVAPLEHSLPRLVGWRATTSWALSVFS